MARARDGEMPFWDHVEELRRRVLVSVAAVGGATLFAFTFALRGATPGGLPVAYPWPSLTDTLSTQMLRKMSEDLLPRSAGVTLVVTGPFDGVVASLQAALFFGLLAGMPVVVHQAWRFVSPALRSGERRLLVRFVAPASLLFVAGNLFSYSLFLPFTLPFLYTYALAAGATPFLHLADFIGIVTLFGAAFGLIFEMPVIMRGLAVLGVVSSGFWRRNWRLATLAIFLFAALLTPDGTGVTMLLVAAPMLALYGTGYLLARAAERRPDSARRAVRRD